MNIFRESGYFAAGIGFLALAKAKHLLQGYTTPKPFPVTETDRCIDYDVSIVEQWLSHGVTVVDKSVLELGPGSDLGIGLYLLSKGACRYSAVDRHNLVAQVPDEFYLRMEERLAVPKLSDALRDGRINYYVSRTFDIRAVVPAASIDVVVSNAAFEHFTDIAGTVADLTQVVKPGGRICAIIDLQTHSRWIRDADPNNIYRYPDWLYRSFHFPGQPNRVRPIEYVRMFESHGWRDVTIEATRTFDSTGRSVYRRFANDTDLEKLSIVLRAMRA